MRVSVCVGLVRVFFGGIVGVYMFFFCLGRFRFHGSGLGFRVQPMFTIEGLGFRILQCLTKELISPSIPPVKCIFIRYGHTLDTRPRSF